MRDSFLSFAMLTAGDGSGQICLRAYLRAKLALYSNPNPLMNKKIFSQGEDIYLFMVGNEGFEPPMPDSESGALPLGEFPTDDLTHSVMGMRGRNALNGISSQPPMFCVELEVTTWWIPNSSSECRKFCFFASFLVFIREPPEHLPSIFFPIVRGHLMLCIKYCLYQMLCFWIGEIDGVDLFLTKSDGEFIHHRHTIDC